jgi:predicted small lipoprotein YifL
VIGESKKLFLQRRGDALCRAFSVTTALKLFVAAALVMPIAACGTKTELLMPNGKPTPRDQRDPSQPPSPISR